MLEEDDDEDDDASPLELDELLEEDDEASNGSPLLEVELVEVVEDDPDEAPFIASLVAASAWTTSSSSVASRLPTPEMAVHATSTHAASTVATAV